MTSQRAANALVLNARKQVASHLEIEKHPYTQDQTLFENIAAVSTSKFETRTGGFVATRPGRMCIRYSSD